MMTDIEIDDDLLREAMEAFGSDDVGAIVEYALRRAAGWEIPPHLESFLKGR